MAKSFEYVMCYCRGPERSFKRPLKYPFMRSSILELGAFRTQTAGRGAVRNDIPLAHTIAGD